MQKLTKKKKWGSVIKFKGYKRTPMKDGCGGGGVKETENVNHGGLLILASTGKKTELN